MTAGAGPVSRLFMAAWLVAMWVFLWGELSPANVAGGMAAALLLLWAFPVGPPRDPSMAFRPLPVLRLLVWFAWALVVSSVQVAGQVIVPASRSRIRSGIVAAPLRTRSPRLATMVANAITLTPGTLTVEARGEPPVLYVHVLSLVDEADLRADVAAIERRVLRAFGPPAEVAALDAEEPGPAVAIPAAPTSGEGDAR